MITKEEKISYLKQFYTDEELSTFDCFTNEAALTELYEYSQPVEMNIEDVRFANEGGVTLVDSPDGWVEIEQWRNKGTKKVYDLLLANGSYITASHDHLFQVLNGEWKFTREIKVGMTLLTQLGGSTVVMIKEAGDQVVYDLAINHKNHRYYTNGISSHNSGKSLFLQNLALNWSFMGYDVVYFSLELSEALVSSRLDCMVSNMGTKDLFKRISDASMSIKMTQKSKRAGKVTVKKMPEAGTTTNVLRAYLKEYEIQMGKRPDVVVVDYLDIMYPNNSKIDPTNAFAKDKYVSEELRAMYSELNLLGASASQLNRCLSLDTKVVINGKETEIRNVKVGDWLDSENGPVKVYEVLPTTKQEVFEITTKSGKKIKVSANHKFPMKDGSLRTINSGLSVGNMLRVKKVEIPSI